MLTVKASLFAWDRTALGKPASSSYLGLNFAGAPSTIQVQIRWKTILLDVLQTPGGTEPVYSCNETMDDMFQVRVSFGLPLNRSAITFKDIDVIGTKCSTLFEEESEASAAAFRELQHGCLSIRVMDVGRTRSSELEKTCQEILVNASELYHGIKSVLLDWENNMHKAEGCYRPTHQRVLENMNHRVFKTHSDIRTDVAEQLFKLTRANYLKLKELTSETEEVKSNIEKVHDRVEYFFCEPSIHEINEHRGSLPPKTRLRMKLVLQEMMITLGWAVPTFNIIRSGLSSYVCETSLFLGNLYVGVRSMTLTIAGSEAPSK